MLKRMITAIRIFIKVLKGDSVYPLVDSKGPFEISPFLKGRLQLVSDLIKHRYSHTKAGGFVPPLSNKPPFHIAEHHGPKYKIGDVVENRGIVYVIRYVGQTYYAVLRLDPPVPGGLTNANYNADIIDFDNHSHLVTA